ncbi:hypothetical protein BCR43DRAFT_489477 [Syncephalastrum racemosum]|uniref:Uncharacterized protein n=1 Tax=Syncephalastrum racemosum TaxID=13706 RepID=A0A1X2HE74_SYNRA|nr:hypothetical protein BCR43DRAFT_489477 [Syncephalastrum racemosum]
MSTSHNHPCLPLVFACFEFFRPSSHFYFLLTSSLYLSVMLRSSVVVNYARPSLQTLRRNYSAAAAVQPVVEVADEPVQEQKPRNLSARLGGSGRGKRTDDTVDPFSAFLHEARQNRRSNMNRQNNNNNNNNRRNAQRKPQQQAAPGQFDDAVEETTQPRQQNNRNNNNKNFNNNTRNNNYRNTNNRQPQQQRANGKNDRRQGDQPQRRQKRGPVMGASSATGPARRVTTFIDKDLDWSAMSSFANVESGPIEVGETNQVVAELKQGEYARYLALTETMTWAPGMDQSALSSLVGGNASYSLEQKAAFLNAISSATASSSPAAAASKQ